MFFLIKSTIYSSDYNHHCDKDTYKILLIDAEKEYSASRNFIAVLRDCSALYGLF